MGNVYLLLTKAHRTGNRLLNMHNPFFERKPKKTGRQTYFPLLRRRSVIFRRELIKFEPRERELVLLSVLK